MNEMILLILIYFVCFNVHKQMFFSSWILHTLINLQSCDSHLFCVGFNSVPNMIVFMFNLLYHVFYVGFYCKGCV